MERYKYVRLKVAEIPDDVINEYNLQDKVSKVGYVYLRIRKEVYSLPFDEKIAQELLEKRLNAKGCRQSAICPGFWKHDWRPICVSLFVDDFGVKNVKKEHAEHHMASLQEKYTISHEWEGKRYIGLAIDWDYDQGEVHISIPNYIQDALTRFHHHQPKKPQDQPHPHIAPKHGTKQQFTEVEDTPPLSQY